MTTDPLVGHGQDEALSSDTQADTISVERTVSSMFTARRCLRIATSFAIAFSLGCAGHEVAKGAKPAVVQAPSAAGQPARPPEIVRVDPLASPGGGKAPGLVALEDELRRAMSLK